LLSPPIGLLLVAVCTIRDRIASAPRGAAGCGNNRRPPESFSVDSRYRDAMANTSGRSTK